MRTSTNGHKEPGEYFRLAKATIDELIGDIERADEAYVAAQDKLRAEEQGLADTQALLVAAKDRLTTALANDEDATGPQKYYEAAQTAAGKAGEAVAIRTDVLEKLRQASQTLRETSRHPMVSVRQAQVTELMTELAKIFEQAKPLLAEISALDTLPGSQTGDVQTPETVVVNELAFRLEQFVSPSHAGGLNDLVLLPLRDRIIQKVG